jgi:methyl-accepting chemotaxis protein
VLVDYNKHFNASVEAHKKIGLHPKDGLYGELRSAVHGVEELLGNKDFKLLSNMLQLRRNEIDFMLLRDEKYLIRCQDNAATFVDNINESSLDSSLKLQVIELLSVYQHDFENLVSTQKEMGLDLHC